MKAITLFLLLLLCAVSIAQVKWRSSYADAAKVATAQRKPILIDFSAEWCGPCKMMEREVFPNGKVQALLGKVVPLKLDVDTNPPEAQKFKVNGIPRMILLSPDGKKILWDGTGYRDAEMLVGELSDALGIKVSSLKASAAKPEPAALGKARAALAGGSWPALKAADPKRSAEGLRLIVEQLGAFSENDFKENANLLAKAGRDAIPALLAGMDHKHLAIRTGSYRALLLILGRPDATQPKFDPWLPKAARLQALSKLRTWLASRLSV
jgi:thiol-disulfide isomerase/thioredoxin